MLPLTETEPLRHSNECALLVSRSLLVQAEMQWVAAPQPRHWGGGAVFEEPKQTCLSTAQAPPLCWQSPEHLTLYQPVDHRVDHGSTLYNAKWIYS